MTKAELEIVCMAHTIAIAAVLKAVPQAHQHSEALLRTLHMLLGTPKG